MTVVYVMTYAPAGNEGGVGGHDWHPDLFAIAEPFAHRVLESVNDGGTHVVRLLAVDVPYLDEVVSHPDPQVRVAVTEWLIENTDHLEDDWPAIQQFVPDGAPVPSGGAVQDPR